MVRFTITMSEDEHKKALVEKWRKKLTWTQVVMRGLDLEYSPKKRGRPTLDNLYRDTEWGKDEAKRNRSVKKDSAKDIQTLTLDLIQDHSRRGRKN